MNYLNYIKKFQQPDGPIKGTDQNQSVLTQGIPSPSWGRSVRLQWGKISQDSKRIWEEAKDFVKEKAHAEDFFKDMNAAQAQHYIDLGNQYMTNGEKVTTEVLSEEAKERNKDRQELVSFVPYVGDVKDTGEAAQEAKKGNLLGAGIILTSMILPEVLEKGARKFGEKYVKSKLAGKKLTSHLQGDDAIRMFKEYGGEPIPDSFEGKQYLQTYVNEARLKYGLVGNKDITDEEISQALYKQAKEIAGNDNPMLLFRGDTQSYTELKDRLSPTELSKGSGTMDNSLGNLFLGELPNSSVRGFDYGTGRYLVTRHGARSPEGSGTGATPIGKLAELPFEEGMTKVFSEGAYALGPVYRGNGELDDFLIKLPAKYSSTGVNDLNLFVPKNPKIRESTPEISVLSDNQLIGGFQVSGVQIRPYKGKKFKVGEKDKESVFEVTDLNTGNTESFLGISGGTTTPFSRAAIADHYEEVLKSAKNRNQTLLRSQKYSPIRAEHGQYTYYALPNYAKGTVKHILPYDLRIPRDWSDSNIFRIGVPIIGVGAAASAISTEKKQHGGTLNYLNYVQ